MGKRRIEWRENETGSEAVIEGFRIILLITVVEFM